MRHRREHKRALAITLAVVAAAGLIVAAFARDWLVTVDFGGDSKTIGLREYERCTHECKMLDIFDLVDEVEDVIEKNTERNKSLQRHEQLYVPYEPWHGVPIIGIITFVAALVGAAGLLLGAILALARKRVAWPVMPTTIGVLGLALGIINACLFIATKPDVSEPLSVGWAFWTFAGGAVVGLAAVFPLNRQIRPIDEELGAAAATMSWGGSRDDLP